jgi:hypothetical protein
MDQESDGNSLGSNDLPPPAKPLLAAALKAKQQSKEEEESTKPAKLCDVDPWSGDHLKDTNQPKTQYGDKGDSLGSNDLFDAPKGPPPAKPLLAAALKAKQKSEEEAKAKPSGVDPTSGILLKDMN